MSKKYCTEYIVFTNASFQYPTPPIQQNTKTKRKHFYSTLKYPSSLHILYKKFSFPEHPNSALSIQGTNEATIHSSLNKLTGTKARLICYQVAITNCLVASAIYFGSHFDVALMHRARMPAPLPSIVAQKQLRISLFERRNKD